MLNLILQLIVGDELTGLFRDPGETGWMKVVLNREGTCAGCGKTVAAGSEGFMRRRPGWLEVRCGECGAGT